MRRTLQILGCIGWLLVFDAAMASTQSVERLNGTIRDPAGNAVAGATVTVTGGGLITPATAVSDDRGRYEFVPLPPGRYVVECAAAGFDQARGDVDVRVEGATLDLALAVAPLFERLTVTGTKAGTAEIQSTPIAITALSARTLEQLGARNIEGLAGFVPTLTIAQHTGLAEVTIRGIGSNAVFAGSDPSTTIHLDGVYLARPAMAFADFLDVERVEVLRGPQGTLYGRNSVGGTINVVTRQPANLPETRLQLTAGDFNTLRVAGDLSGPLIKDKAMGSIAILRSSRDGFVRDLDHRDHSLGTEDTWAGRGRLRMVFGPRSELVLSADGGRFAGVPLHWVKPIVAKPGFTFDSPASLWDVRTSDVTTGRNIQRGASARLTVPIDDRTSVNSLTAWRASNDRFFVDADATELRISALRLSDVQHQVSQEVTLVHQAPALTWIAGAFVFDEHDEGEIEVTAYPSDTQTRPFATTGTRAWAAFGQATYRVSNRVSLTGGVRDTDERKDIVSTGGVYRLGTPILAVPASFYAFDDRAAFHAWTPKTALEVRAARDTFLYVSATRGFKSGGFNPTGNAPGRAFGPELAWSYEGGVKETAAEGRMRVNTAMFVTDYRDLQVQAFIRPGVTDISNAAAATIKGVEVELAATPWRALQLAGQVAWLDAIYGRYVAIGLAAITADVAGHRLNNAPAWSSSSSATYELPAGPAGAVMLHGDVSWQSRVFFTPFNDAIETQQAYALVHLRTAFEPRSRRWELAVYVRNAGGRAYITSTATNVALPAFNGRPGEPRRWGTQFTVRR
ncbi:MAG: TonB-dependent receptor [Acidobacteria bacterium]|nr:TonB-dependent receptor [Acidobacteriota bacterium]